MKTTQFGVWTIVVGSEEVDFVQDKNRCILLNSEKYYMFLAELDKDNNISIQNIDSDIELKINYLDKSINVFLGD
ncbi:hypothetical protein [Terrilactibacillus laevilacticus]|uniref:Uncharacterized protein n=1 Tax=Terrilactibacillus laevilacticus TaxID=1380157 RepID=A0ABW5PT69_9BACI|nr:hypothetical protein [Terrilactibacillus laevilacticus]